FLVVLIVIAISFACWAKGRGYVYALRKRLHLIKPVLVDGRVAFSIPADGTMDVALDTKIEAELSFKTGGIDLRTVNPQSVLLIRTSDQTVVPTTVQVRGRSRLSVRSVSPMEAGTNYTLYVTNDVRLTGGETITPYQICFTTRAPKDPAIRFERIPLAA